MVSMRGRVEGHARESLKTLQGILFFEHEAHPLQVSFRLTSHHVLCWFVRPLGDQPHEKALCSSNLHRVETVRAQTHLK